MRSIPICIASVAQILYRSKDKNKSHQSEGKSHEKLSFRITWSLFGHLFYIFYNIAMNKELRVLTVST